MNKFLFVVLLLWTGVLHAQDAGQIVYEEKIDLHRRLTGDRAQFKEMVPQYRTSKMLLLYSGAESIYKKSEEEAAAPPPEAGRRRGFRMRMMGAANGIVYRDLDQNKRVEQREFMDKKFLITGEPEQFAWKLTGESMQVGSYHCQQATFQDSTTQITAWFTPQIPVALGPGRYGQLPGLILHVDINEGERTLTATEINLEEVDTAEISEPTKGKEVTQEEFRKITREKMREMRASRQGGPRTIIRRGN
ncbi:MAG: GLPGLI family protein [Saprospiraceae bacterium]|nr:GLPGLI family protein [Saprospiraceae bacterium]